MIARNTEGAVSNRQGKDEAPEYDASQNPFADMDLEERFIVSDASAQYHDNFNFIKMQK